MGMSLMSSCFTNCDVKAIPNPHPSRFQLRQYIEINGNLVVCVQYIDCTNFEGLKVMLYKSVRIAEFLKWNRVDPHFDSECPDSSPVARFVPTNEGWTMACDLANNI